MTFLTFFVAILDQFAFASFQAMIGRFWRVAKVADDGIDCTTVDQTADMEDRRAISCSSSKYIVYT